MGVAGVLEGVAVCCPCYWLATLTQASWLTQPSTDDIYANVCLKPSLSAAASLGGASPRRPSAFPASQARQLALMLRGHPAGISTSPMLGERAAVALLANPNDSTQTRCRASGSTG